MYLIWTTVHDALGLDAASLTVWQMGLRAMVVYVVAIVLVRLGDKRFLGKHTALDIILGFMLGSILSRAITGNSPFFETLGAALVLVLMHWLFAVVAFRSDGFGTLVKGHTEVLVRDGEILWDAMKTSQISENDLLGALRANAGTNDPSDIAIACLERNGDISAQKRKQAPRVVDVHVEEGVQTVRVKLD